MATAGLIFAWVLLAFMHFASVFLALVLEGARGAIVKTFAWLLLGFKHFALGRRACGRA